MYIPEEKSTGTYAVIKESENIFKLVYNDPFYEELRHGTIIEAVKGEDDIYEFIKVKTESEYTLQVIGIPMNLSEQELRIVGDMIVKEGGFWEVIFGGMGYVNLPKGSSLNVINELNNISKLKRENRS